MTPAMPGPGMSPLLAWSILLGSALPQESSLWHSDLVMPGEPPCSPRLRAEPSLVFLGWDPRGLLAHISCQFCCNNYVFCCLKLKMNFIHGSPPTA